jgi:hypothetical protein
MIHMTIPFVIEISGALLALIQLPKTPEEGSEPWNR